MATTTLLQRHAGEGETIAEAIRDCLDYGKDPEKTESGKYISAYECDPATVADEFLLAKASYAAMTGREQKKENNVLCYQIRQSFYPGEITPKEANRIGYELAMRWTKGRHAFIVTTHTDKQHIHCHIYYNSTTLDCTRKFRNFWGSSFALRRLSDRLCLENGLSIVENPKPRSKGKYRNYGEWQKDRKGPLSYQDRLRLAIDTALAERPADLDEFLNLMKRAGYEVMASYWNASLEDVTRIVNGCIQVGLFNGELYEKHRILTSADIQRNYMDHVRSCGLLSRYPDIPKEFELSAS